MQNNNPLTNESSIFKNHLLPFSLSLSHAFIHSCFVSLLQTHICIVLNARQTIDTCIDADDAVGFFSKFLVSFCCCCYCCCHKLVARIVLLLFLDLQPTLLTFWCISHFIFKRMINEFVCVFRMFNTNAPADVLFIAVFIFWRLLFTVNMRIF